MNQLHFQVTTIINASKEGEEKKEISKPKLVTYILSFVASKTAGSPTDNTKQWVNSRPSDISKHLFECYQEKVSNSQIKRILKSNGYCPYKPLKRLATGSSPDREEQFNIISELTDLFRKMAHNPIISIDTKKKEVLGQLTRNQPVLCQKEQIPDVYDHDYSYTLNGVKNRKVVKPKGQVIFK